MPLSASSIRVVPATNQVVPGVGRYRYIAMLAEGGMADVYLAVTHSAGFEKLVVIKQLRDSLAQDPSFVAMFMDEARLAARLNHPNVVQTLEVGTDGPTGLHFIAMEFLEGVAHVRFARLKERVPAPLSFHLRILIDVLRGLHYAHELRDFDGRPLNVVHRDVSPQNVMLTFEGGVKVLDFGIAKAALAAEQRPEDFKGKLEYMAPEQARMEDVDRRADIFSVGVMLFEALTRRRLYRKGDDKLGMLTSGRLPRVLDVSDGVPKKLATICTKAMSHDRGSRYQTANAMADDLEDWLLSTIQHVTARDVGAYIAEKFASTRTKISAAIEAQLALIHAMPERPEASPRESTSPETVPLHRPLYPELAQLKEPPAGYTIPPPGGSIPPQHSIPPQPTIPPHPTGSFPAQPYPSGPPMPPYGGPMGAPATSGVWTESGHPATGSIPVPVTAPSGNRSSTPKVLALIAALTCVVLLGGAVVFLKGKRANSVSGAGTRASGTVVVATAPSSAASATPLGLADSGAEPVAQIEFTIKASPPEAKIFLDEKALDSNPATGKRPRDGAMHHLRIEAPGHDPREETIAFDRSIFINVDLRPIPAAFEVPASPNSGTPRAGRSTRPTRAPRSRVPGKSLDSENPYK